jgi:hypothetical protein
MLVYRYWHGPKFDGFDWIASTVRNTVGEFIQYSEPPILDERVRKIDQIRHYSNLKRLQLLYEFGGLWLDCDIIPLIDLRRSYPYTASLGGRREGSVMCFPEPKHEFLWSALNKIDSTTDNNTQGSKISGAHMLESLPNFGVERVEMFSHDAKGRLVSRNPLVIHLWNSSYVRHN